MMLRALLPGIAQRYAFAGLALGFLLPALGHLIEFVAYPDHPLAVRPGEPFHALAYALPFVLAAVFYRFGASRAQFLVRLSAGEVIERELLHMSLHDRLTGLPNRMALEREVARFAAASSQGRARPAFLLLDLDKFKHVNDTLGHDAGDELLQLFSIRLTGAVGSQARVYRLGGDEFAVTVPGSPNDDDIEHLCRAIEVRSSEPFELRAGRALIGVSIGAAFFEAGDTSMPDVMKRADLALYAAKEVTGSAHIFHDGVLAEGVQQRMRTEQEIASGLLREEFFVEYQPVVSASMREISAFEALVRWRHPRRGVLGPEEFISIAERSGHIVALGRVVLNRALEDAGRWPTSIGVAVNVSTEEFRSPDFADHIRILLEIHGVAPERLTIELGESAFTMDEDLIRQRLSDLRAVGVKVAIDDFGAGLFSINHLRQFPVDELKIDRSFTRELLEDRRGAELVEIILKLGRAFGASTTVEGVESEDQLEIVRALGAADVQGFLISRPLPARDARALAFGRSPPREAMRFSA